jgi:peptide/nickel transport system substrate-binding protein/oligopeptide transport system substrate-binding protein
MNQEEEHAQRLKGGVPLLLFLLATAMPPSVSSAATPPPSVGGTLRIARLFDPVTLDAGKVELAEDFLLVPLLHQTLLDLRDGTNLIPGAASAWSVSPDKQLYTFQLRPGVRFSNGREVVASDYVCALERIVNPTNAAMLSGYFQHVRGVKDFALGLTNHVAGLSAPAPNTFTIALEHPDPVFIYLLTTIAAVPSKEMERLGSRLALDPVCTGPYLVRDWKRGVRLRLMRNPYYHGVEPQHFDGIDIMIGGDEATHLMMFERGELDIANLTLADGIPLPSFRRLSNDPRWHDLIQREDLFSTAYLSLNTEVAPLDNVLVRRAINHAINRDKWKRAGLGYATHGEGVLPRIMPGFDPSLRGYDFNPEKARALLAETHLPLPLHTVLWHALDEPSQFLAQGVQGDLKQVGIEVDLKPVTFAQLISSGEVRHQVPMAAVSWTVSIPDPSDILGMLCDGRTITNPPTMNLSFYQNPEVNRLLDEAAPESDLARRFALYRQAERIIVHDAPWAFLGHGAVYGLHQRWLKGPWMDPIWIYRLDRLWTEH